MYVYLIIIHGSAGSPNNPTDFSKRGGTPTLHEGTPISKTRGRGTPYTASNGATTQSKFHHSKQKRGWYPVKNMRGGYLPTQPPLLCKTGYHPPMGCPAAYPSSNVVTPNTSSSGRGTGSGAEYIRAV